MWTEPVRPFLEGGLALLPLAMLCAVPPDQPIEKVLRSVVHAIDRRLAAEPNYAQAVRIMTGAFRLAHLRVPRDRVEFIFEGAGIMHEIVGWDQLEEEGVLKGHREVLTYLGRKHLGAPDAKTKTALASIEDTKRLKKMADAVTSVKSWKALLAVK